MSKSIERSTLAVTVLAPAAALAASGDPGAGAGMGSHSPASQPTAPKQRQGAMNDDKTAPAGPAHMTRGAADPAAAKGATNVPERGGGRRAPDEPVRLRPISAMAARLEPNSPA